MTLVLVADKPKTTSKSEDLSDKIRALEEKLEDMEERLAQRFEQLERVREHFDISPIDWIPFMEGYPLRNDPVVALKAQLRDALANRDRKAELALLETENRLQRTEQELGDVAQEAKRATEAEALLDDLVSRLDKYTKDDDKKPY